MTKKKKKIEVNKSCFQAQDIKLLETKVEQHHKADICSFTNPNWKVMDNFDTDGRICFERDPKV